MVELKEKGYIEQLIAEGEHEHQDFKYQITDAKKIARSISAFANNSGGHLLVGVKDNGHIAGVRSEEEIYMIEQAATLCCRPEQRVEFSIFKIEGKSVLKVDIAEACDKPVKALDETGRWKAYYRVADENVLASGMHVKVMQQQNADCGNAVISFSDREKTLIDYLNTHGGISLNGYMKLVHISRRSAEESMLKLCEMGVIKLNYHNGHCVFTKGEFI